MLLVIYLVGSLCAEEVKKASPTKIALVTNTRSKDAQNVMALAEVELSAHKNIVLLERKKIDKLLAEHKLTLSGLTDVKTALQVGKVLSIDLLAILEGDPKAKKQDVMEGKRGREKGSGSILFGTVFAGVGGKKSGITKRLPRK